MDRKVSSISFSFLSFIVLGIASPAFALDMEFFTYGGFDVVLDAWKGLALVFGDNGYKALFFSVIVLGIFLGGATSYFRLLMGARGSALAWVWPIMLGVMIYLGLIVPKGTVTVYDPVQNKFEPVGGVPNGLVAVAGILNKIEYGVVEILHTAGSVRDYQNSAGGIGFSALLGVTGQQLPIGDEYLMMSLDKYNEKCVLFEMTLPTARISHEEVKNQAIDFVPIWERANNPAIYTIYYDDANRGGITVTCRDAWNGNGSVAGIKSQALDMNSIEKGFKGVCGAVGFDANDAMQYQRCRELIGNYADFIHNGNYGADNFARQSAIAKSLEYTLLRLNPDISTAAQIARNSMTSGIGMGIAANEWIPITRAVFTAIFLGLIPVIALMIPTGLAGRAIGYMAGFFVWLTLWGIADAIVHIASTNLAYKVMEGVRQSNLGYTSIMLWPTYGQKALAQFGMMRSVGMLLAGAVSWGIFRFGGHAMVAMTSGAISSVQAHGAQAAHVSGTPEGSASAVDSWRGSVPTMANAYKNEWRESIEANAALRVGEQAGRIQAMHQMGGPQALESAVGHREGVNQVSGLTHAQQLNFGDAARAGMIGGMEQRERAWNNTAQAMVDSGMARDLNEAHSMMTSIQAQGGVIGLQATAGQVEGVGGDLSKFHQMAAQDTGIKMGGFQQKQHEMAFAGMDETRYGQWVEGGRILDEQMAAKLQASGFSGAKAGMKASLGFDRDGNVAFMTGQMETGKYGAVYSGGLLKESYAGEGYALNRTLSPDGRVMNVEGIRGQRFLDQDKVDREYSRMATSRTGSEKIRYDVDETRVSDGTVYDMATMFTASTTRRGSDRVAGRIVSAAPGEMREKEISTAAAAFAQSVNIVASRRGTASDTSSAGANVSGGVNFGFVRASGNAGVAAQSADERMLNLIGSQYSQTVHTALDEAGGRGFDAGKTRAHVSEAIQAFSAKIQTEMNKASTKDYGSTAAGKAVVDAVTVPPTDFEMPR
jgi:hypothetical protein